MALSKVDLANQVENQLPQGLVANNLPYRNIIINGDMSIAQRNTSVAGITSGGYLTVDRQSFVIVNQGTFTMSQETDVPSGQGFTKSLKFNCTTADASPTGTDRLYLSNRFEGQNLQYLKKGTANAESVTASFWVKSNKTGTYIAELFDNDNTRQISQAYTINSSNTWEKKTLTYEGDTSGALDNDNNNSLELNLWFGGGSTFTGGTLNTSWNANVNNKRASGVVNLADNTANEWYITGVQLEAGTTASDFEFLPYDMNLERCQRYYQVDDYVASGYITVGQAFNSTTAGGVYYFKKMRAAPAVTFPPASLSNGGVFLAANGGFPSSAGTNSISNISDTNFRILGSGYTGLTASGPSVCFSQGATQQVKMDAEL